MIFNFNDKVGEHTIFLSFCKKLNSFAVKQLKTAAKNSKSTWLFRFAFTITLNWGACQQFWVHCWQIFQSNQAVFKFQEKDQQHLCSAPCFSNTRNCGSNRKQRNKQILQSSQFAFKFLATKRIKVLFSFGKYLCAPANNQTKWLSSVGVQEFKLHDKACTIAQCTST